MLTDIRRAAERTELDVPSLSLPLGGELDVSLDGHGYACSNQMRTTRPRPGGES